MKEDNNMELNKENLPVHIAIIMDGNRRWAKEKDLETKQGHKEGAENLKRIAKYAVSLVQNGQIIYLDSGTTNMEIAKQLKSKQNLTVVTNDIKIAGYLSFSCPDDSSAHPGSGGWQVPTAI